MSGLSIWLSYSIDSPFQPLKNTTLYLPDTADSAEQNGGTLLANFDIQAAYRTVLGHTDDCHLLGMMWKEEVYIDITLPLGLRSAPEIFNAIAEALKCVMKARQVHHVAHCLDDDIALASPGAKECAGSVWSKKHPGPTPK